MINVVGSTPIPAAPLPPTLPSEAPIDPTQVTGGTAAGSPSTPSSFQPPKKKRRFSPKQLLMGLLLLLLILGSGVGLYLMKLNQDLRQQASVTYDEDGCNQNSAANCQGRPVGFICDNNPPGSGVCESVGDGACTCRRSDDDNNRGGGTCVEQCPAGDGVLRSCSPPEADGTPQESICNVAKRVESCGGRDYCCPAPGAQWTTDMRLCETVSCAQVITPARNPSTDECQEFPTPCDVPDGWETVQSCDDQTDDEEEDQDDDDEEQQDDNDDDDQDNDRDDNDSDSDDDDDRDTLADAGRTTATPTPTQPALPSTLPQSGPENWMQYLQIGLGALGIGALLLLFL
jgi:hypothetical protein